MINIYICIGALTSPRGYRPPIAYILNVYMTQ